MPARVQTRLWSIWYKPFTKHHAKQPRPDVLACLSQVASTSGLQPQEEVII